jgi:four helix bundle protein
MSYIKEFTDLESWRQAHALVLMIYKLIHNFPEYEKYRLIDQLCRASISITSNIAEGFGRFTYKEKIHFYYIASGSLSEVKNQLIIAKDLEYISEDDYQKLDTQLITTFKLLKGLIKKSRSYQSL